MTHHSHSSQSRHRQADGPLEKTIIRFKSNTNTLTSNRSPLTTPFAETTPGLRCCMGVAVLCPVSLPSRTGVTTAYRSRSSYSSLRLVDTELPRLPEGTSGEEGVVTLLCKLCCCNSIAVEIGFVPNYFIQNSLQLIRACAHVDITCAFRI